MESVFLLIEGIASSIAFRIATRLNIGRTRWQRILLELVVFVLLVIPLFMAIGFLLWVSFSLLF